MPNKVVRCSRCREEIFELTGIPDRGYPIVAAKDFIGINGNRDPITCEETLCPKCGANIFNEICEVYRRNT